MTPRVIDRDLRRPERRISDASQRDAEAAFNTLFGMKQVRSARRAEAKPKLRALIACAHVFRRLPANFVRAAKAGKRCEHAARPPLTCIAMAKSYAARLALKRDTQLTALT